ncbi:MAG: hypothetical protein H3C68_01430 [Deltaproteobacteria bacterium]|nr:hypothetical protein [Deltaproteobacteria bacterium]MBZ0219085.1 hypothetical protein [Deltaproteobacteria bacterium]
MSTARKNSPKASKITTDHDEIRNWVESRGGHPASVKKTREGDGSGILRIDFPGYKGGGSLESISWEEFFEQFENRKLAFLYQLYQEETVSGEVSRFNKIVSREESE